MKFDITWLHISDLHFGHRNREDEKNRIPPKKIGDGIILDSRKMAKEIGSPDLIFVTGDIANKGKALEYKRATTWLNKLLECVGLPGKKDRIFVVPGNHDIERNSDRSEDVKKFDKVLITNPREAAKMLDDPELVSMISREKMGHYGLFEQMYHSEKGHKSKGPYWFQEVNSCLGKVIVVGLNTALCAYDKQDSDKRLALGYSQLRELIAEQERGALLLVLMHHPPSWLQDGNKLIKELCKYPNLVFMGHIHMPGVETLSKLSEGEATFFIAGAATETSSSSHYYSWGRISGDGISYYPRIWLGTAFTRNHYKHEDISKSGEVPIENKLLSARLKGWMSLAQHTIKLKGVELASETISKDLRAKVRGFEKTHGEQSIADSYQWMLDGQLKKYGFPSSAFSKWAQNKKVLKEMIKSLPSAGLTVAIENELQSISFGYDGNLLKINAPKLLWDCSCQTLKKKEQKTKCKIHSKGLIAEEVTRRFREKHVIFKWRGMEFMWFDCDDFWPPAIDAFHMVHTLEKHTVLSDDSVQSILDIGSGTGFLGIVAACMNKNITRLDMSDWLPLPLHYSMLNWQLNARLNERVKVNPLLGIYTNWYNATKKPKDGYDIVLCNPPYIPIDPSKPGIEIEQTVAGTALLKHVISVAPTLGKKVYIQCSNLAYEDAKEAATNNSVLLHPIGEPVTVPFRIRNALKQKGYIQWLVKKHDLKEYKHRHHTYWHSIQTYKIDW